MNPKRVPCPEEPVPSTSSESPKKSLEEVSNVIDKAITNVAEKFGMGRHPVKGIINRLLRNKEFSKLTAGQTDDLEAELPTIKLTRSKAKFLRKEGIGVGEADLVMRETPKEEEKQEVTKDGLEGESSSSSSGDDSDDEEFIPSEEEGAKKAESEDDSEQEKKEDAPSEGEEEFIVIDEGQVTAQDISPSKAANLNDAAIFDDLAQSNYDLFNLDRLSPSGIRDLDPEYLDFISGPLRNEDEDDDPDYAPKKWQTKKVLKELDDLDESFSMTSPRWEENDNNYNLFKNFVSSVNPQSQNLNLDVFDDEEEDQDYEPQEEAEEESDSEDELDESVAIRAPVADALELKTKSLLTTTFNEEEEGDLDYMYISDDEDEDEEDERRTRRKGITISQREVKWLHVDGADILEDPIFRPAVSLYQQDRQLDREYREAAKEYRKHHKRVTRPMLKRKTCFLAPDDNSDTLLLEEGQTPEFRQCEADQLVQQLEQHVQFAVQGLIQCFHVARLQNERNQYQEMINELETLYQENGENSLFNIVNLPAAIETCHDVWRVELTTNDRAFIEWANAPSNVKGHMPRPESCLVMTRSQALLYPELVPYMQAPEIPAAVSNRYTDYEETLLLLGLIQFAHVPNSSRHTKGRYHLIRKHLLPTREVSQIRERLSNIRKLPVRNQLHNLILEAEDRNPSIAFTPSFPIRVPDFTTMIDWPPELRPVWFEKFVEWFSVTDHIYVAFTGTDDKERIKKEFLIKKPAKQKKKEIVKNKATYGISNYVNVCKYLNSLFHPEDGEGRPESREEERRGEREENNENFLYSGRNAVEDMPDVGMVVPKEDKDKDAGIPATMLMQSTPERSKESGNQKTTGGSSTAPSNVNGRAPSTPSKRVTFKPLSPRNDGGEQQKSAEEDHPPSLPSVDAVMNSNELPAEISNLPSRSKRKQSVPMKKSEADRAERWRNRLAKKTSMSPGTMHRLRTELDMSESDEEEEEERTGKEDDIAQQGTSRLNPAYNADDDVQNMQSLVLPVERRLVDGAHDQGRSSRSCSFVPITPHLRTSSEASSSSPRSDTRFTTPFRTPSPTYAGSQLPAPRTPRDDGMTMSPTLICASNLNLSPHFTLGNDSICVPARRRLVGPTDFSSIDDDNMAGQPGPSSASQQQLLRPPIRARRDILVNTVSDSAQKRWRKRGREEIMRDGQVAMMDGEYRAKQEALLARHIFVDVKRRLSMHRDVMNQIAAIMRSGRKPAQMLLALESLLFDSHRDVLCLLSFTFSSSDASPRLLADPTRKTYRNALDMILAIDAYCSRAKYKISTKNLFKTVTTQCCTGATTPREFTTAMRDLFGNDKPLWEFLKLHMPMYFEETIVPTEMEFIDLTKTDEVGKEEHVDASRVFGAVPANKKRNKVHIQHERLYVYNGTTYVTAQVQKNKDSESSEAPSSSPLKLPRKRKIAPSKTKKPDPPPLQPEVRQEEEEELKEPPPVEPKWTRELDLTILNTYNETEEEDDEAVVDELVRKIPFGREHIGARLKFLLAQFNSL